MMHLSLLWVCVDSNEHEGAGLSLSSSAESAAQMTVIPRDTIATESLSCELATRKKKNSGITTDRVTMIIASLP